MINYSRAVFWNLDWHICLRMRLREYCVIGLRSDGLLRVQVCESDLRYFAFMQIKIVAKRWNTRVIDILRAAMFVLCTCLQLGTCSLCKMRAMYAILGHVYEPQGLVVTDVSLNLQPMGSSGFDGTFIYGFRSGNAFYLV